MHIARNTHGSHESVQERAIKIVEKNVANQKLGAPSTTEFCVTISCDRGNIYVYIVTQTQHFLG